MSRQVGAVASSSQSQQTPEEHFPPVIHPRPWKTVAVRTRMVRGNIYQEHDVYVGYAMNNPSWQLPESKWANPFEYVEDNRLRVQLYKDHIMTRDDLREALVPELYRRRLGCFCSKIGTGACHAEVLAQLVNDRVEAQDLFMPNALIFKGSKSPFSNLYYCKLQHEGESFFCLEQLRAYIMAHKSSQPVMKEIILRCEKASEVCNLAKVVKQRAGMQDESRPEQVCEDSKVVWKRKTLILDMLRLVSLKFSQCPDFRRSAIKHLIEEERIPMEATTSPFWGIGRDITDIPPDFKIESIQKANNILGWIILFVTTNHVECPKLAMPACRDPMSPTCLDRTMMHMKLKYIATDNTFFRGNPPPPIVKGLQLLLETIAQDIHEVAVYAVQEAVEEEELARKKQTPESLRNKKRSNPLPPGFEAKNARFMTPPPAMSYPQPGAPYYNQPLMPAAPGVSLFNYPPPVMLSLPPRPPPPPPPPPPRHEEERKVSSTVSRPPAAAIKPNPSTSKTMRPPTPATAFKSEFPTMKAYCFQAVVPQPPPPQQPTHALPPSPRQGTLPPNVQHDLEEEMGGEGEEEEEEEYEYDDEEEDTHGVVEEGPGAAGQQQQQSRGTDARL